MTQARLVADGTSNATGAVSITFTQQAVNSTYTGAVSVPSSLASTQWQVIKNGTVEGVIQGSGPYQGIQLTSSDLLVLSSLPTAPAAPNTQYQAVLVGELVYGTSAAVIPTIPNSAGNVSAAGGLIAGADLLLNQTGETILTNASYGATFTALRAYQTLLVQVGSLTKTTTVTVESSNTTNPGIGLANQTRGISGANQPAAFDLPCICNPGDLLGITAIAGTNITDAAVVVYGVVEPVGVMLLKASIPQIVPANSPIRWDGRPYPIGQNMAVQTAVAETETLIAAPGAGLYILLQYWNVTIYSATVGGSFGQINATINGAAGPIATASGDGGAPAFAFPPGGLLCDMNTAVTLTASGAAATFVAEATYDIVG